MDSDNVDDEWVETPDILKNWAFAGMSTVIQSCGTKENRINVILLLEKGFGIEVLKTIYLKAVEMEDYESCDAFKDFFEERNIPLEDIRDLFD